jgi:predicted phage terminase large subunit-like protein
MVLSLPKTSDELDSWLSSLPKEQLRKLDLLLTSDSLRDFVRQAWPIVESTRRLTWNWHLDAICSHLEAVSKGQLKRLIINIPRRHTKSSIVSVFWPAWEWTRNPQARFLVGSHALSLCVRDSRHSRQVIESPWYQRNWGSLFKLTTDQNQKTHFENDRQGFRLSRSVGASAVGQGGDFVVVDDPHDPEQVQSDVQRQAVLDWFDGVMVSSIQDPEKSAHVLIMQRVHHKDLTGHLLAQGGYEHLCLPSEFVPERRCVTSIGFSDPRKERGELLFPKRFPQTYVDDQRVRLGHRFAGQHQQNPSPPEGGLAKRHWWRFWVHPGQSFSPVKFQREDGSFHECPQMELPTVPVQGNGHREIKFERVLQSWDMSFKDKKEGSFVAGQVWASVGADKFLLDQDHRQIDFSVTLEAVRSMTKKWPEASEKLVEDKANGPAVISALRHEISGIIEVEPQGGKEARAQSILPEIESGNCYLPHPAIAPWVNKYIEEWAAAPKGDYWDQIDATSQALLRMKQKRLFFHI